MGNSVQATPEYCIHVHGPQSGTAVQPETNRPLCGLQHYGDVLGAHQLSWRQSVLDADHWAYYASVEFSVTIAEVTDPVCYC